MGGIIHTVNPRLFAEQLVYILNHAEDRVLLYDAAFQPLVDALRPQLKTVEHSSLRRRGRRVRAAARRRSPTITLGEGDEREPCMLCYTSGTTGNPKGVLYEHRSTVLHAMAEVQPDISICRAARSRCRSCRCSTPRPGACLSRRRLAGCKIVFTADYTAQAVCDLMRDEG
jgi:fatty-acyl-CoA synthase